MLRFDFETHEPYMRQLYEGLELNINRMNEAKSHAELNRLTLATISTVMKIYEQHEIVLGWNEMGR